MLGQHLGYILLQHLVTLAVTWLDLNYFMMMVVVVQHVMTMMVMTWQEFQWRYASAIIQTPSCPFFAMRTEGGNNSKYSIKVESIFWQIAMYFSSLH